MIENILILIGLTLVPTLELRASIPYGILVLGMNWPAVFLICVVTNILLGPLVYFLLDSFVHVLTRISIIKRIYEKTVERTQKRLERLVKKYGEIGVSIFIGIPLPGSGSYSGALGAFVLGLGMKRFIKANILGVLIAGVLVTLIVLSGTSLFNFIIKWL